MTYSIFPFTVYYFLIIPSSSSFSSIKIILIALSQASTWILFVYVSILGVLEFLEHFFRLLSYNQNSGGKTISSFSSYLFDMEVYFCKETLHTCDTHHAHSVTWLTAWGTQILNMMICLRNEVQHEVKCVRFCYRACEDNQASCYMEYLLQFRQKWQMIFGCSWMMQLWLDIATHQLIRDTESDDSGTWPARFTNVTPTRMLLLTLCLNSTTVHIAFGEHWI